MLTTRACPCDAHYACWSCCEWHPDRHPDRHPVDEDAGAGKGKRKVMSKHEKKLEMARIRAEKIAAARMKRRGKAQSESSSASADEDTDADAAAENDAAGAAQHDAADTHPGPGSGEGHSDSRADDTGAWHAQDQGASEAAHVSEDESQNPCASQSPSAKATLSAAPLSKQERAAAKAALKAEKKQRKDLLKKQRAGSRARARSSTAASSSSSSSEEEATEERVEEAGEADEAAEEGEVALTHAVRRGGGPVEADEDAAAGDEDSLEGDEDSLEAYLAAKDAEAMAKREALGQMEQDVAGVGALVLREGECEPEAPYDEDDPDAFLAQQDAIARRNRWGANAQMEAAVAGEVQGLAEQHYTTGAAEPAEPVERAPLHSHDTVHRAGCADIDVDEEAVGHVEAGHSGVDHVDHVVQHVVQGLAHLHVGEREERSEEAGKVCGAVDCDQQGLHEAQHQGDESVEGCRRLSGAPLGLEVKEEDACQSRGVAAAVREGLVEANTVLDCLREYVKVESLEGDNLYCCSECSRKFREQGRERMAEARQRLNARKSQASLSEDEDDEPAKELDEDRVRAEVKSPALKQTLFWKLPPFLVLNLKRFLQTMRGRMRKVDRVVKFPLSLDLGPFCHRDSTETNTCYTLYGLVEHHGSLNSGHYVAYSSDPGPLSSDPGPLQQPARASGQGQEDASTDALEAGEGGAAKGNERQTRTRGEYRQWYYFSDTTVKPVPVEKVLKSEAYILFYRRS
eukprot:Tamp_05821.p1 GENE.Tamp_05821~~Tamp_05821.p1  ORF type:complete len:742 (+),score=154.46 Tamp_05821:524-2749(+)